MCIFLENLTGMIEEPQRINIRKFARFLYHLRTAVFTKKERLNPFEKKRRGLNSS